MTVLFFWHRFQSHFRDSSREAALSYQRCCCNRQDRRGFACGSWKCRAFYAICFCACHRWPRAQKKITNRSDFWYICYNKNTGCQPIDREFCVHTLHDYPIRLHKNKRIRRVANQAFFGALCLLAEILFLPKYRYGHPDLFLLKLCTKIFTRAKDPENVSFNFEHKISPHNHR